MEVGLGPGHIVLDGDPAPLPKKGAQPFLQFSAHVYCDQTAGLIKMKLGMQIGLGPSHTVLDEDPATPLRKMHSPQFLAHICCGEMAGWIKIQIGREVSLSPSDIVLDGDPAPPPQKKGSRVSPNFRPMSIVAKRLDR